jgi:hypothetical protein
MTTSSPTTQAALLAALKAIMAECGRTPGQRPYDLDSYLPAHLLDAAQRAIDAAEAPAHIPGIDNPPFQIGGASHE